LSEEFGKTSEEGRRGKEMIKDLCTLLLPPTSGLEFNPEDKGITEHMSGADIFNVRFFIYILAIIYSCKKSCNLITY